MSFLIYDLTFLIVFSLAVFIFLRRNKKNLQRQGIMYLYKTKVGLRLMEYTTKKFASILRPLQYLIVVSGYALMATITWFILKFSWIYITSPFLAEQIRVPILMPLVPYLPEITGLDLPSFPFTYWIIIIAIIAIPHEFAHGIFARLNKINVHSTGFGFLGPFLAAFVEPDEKEMNKSSKFSQLSILAAGTFANVLTTIFFAGVIWLFFTMAFIPAGVQFSTYALTSVNASQISGIETVTLDGFLDSRDPLVPNTQITINDKIFYTSSFILEQSQAQELEQLVVYENSPAFNSRLKGAITYIDNEAITSQQVLTQTLATYSPGDEIEIKTNYKGEELEYQLNLGDREGKAFLGIGTSRPAQSSGALSFLKIFLGEVKDPGIYYTSPLGDFADFIFDLLWWTVIISFSVALINMLPVGLFDGGRYFYITIWGITGSESFAKKAYSFSTWFILLVVALMMARWIFIFF